MPKFFEKEFNFFHEFEDIFSGFYAAPLVKRCRHCKKILPWDVFYIKSSTGKTLEEWQSTVCADRKS